jgi:hypothetical protein
MMLSVEDNFLDSMNQSMLLLCFSNHWLYIISLSPGDTFKSEIFIFHITVLDGHESTIMPSTANAFHSTHMTSLLQILRQL